MNNKTFNEHQISITDSSLRDGNHAVGHQLDVPMIRKYCQLVEEANVSIVEIGHGNGLGASSLLVGESRITDIEFIETARSELNNSKLGMHVIPGFATIKRDLKTAIDLGVDVFRIASHCTEADITQRHIQYCRENNKKVFGVLMMSHMAEAETLVGEAIKMQGYGAEGVILMDSAGAYLPSDVREKVSKLVNSLSIQVGFHAHNNLGLSVANSLVAVECGASLIDGCSRGFGAGAGNAPIELLVSVFKKMEIETGIDLYKILDAADWAETHMIKSNPGISSGSIISAFAGVFSGFLKPVNRISKKFSLDPRDVFVELGKRKVVAGQEDVILEVAEYLKSSK